MKEIKKLYFPLALFLSFLVYLLTVSPQVFWRDSGELTSVAYTLGIAHPAGSPLYVMLGKLSTFLPLGSIAFKLNLLSTACALATIFLLYKTLQLLRDQYFPVKKKAL